MKKRENGRYKLDNLNKRCIQDIDSPSAGQRTHSSPNKALPSRLDICSFGVKTQSIFNHSFGVADNLTRPRPLLGWN